ncbi:MAG: hypothetical protein TU35_000595 [Thermoproteus sp. AZ2]|jgi:hypothetical protein|uniref:Uncharacterized protein n=1 Tax=Thermoproteus sp. AZ2 TaxID=1609232 RepID=A0ACC6UYK3_9CREN|nr:MAG: hypothetical protein TU35_07350 [Thermoproteus sp. AZ2]
MQRIIKSRNFIFEGGLDDAIKARLGAWGRIIPKGDLVFFELDSGEVKVRALGGDARTSLRRIYIKPACGCVMELDEVRNFDDGSISYKLVKFKPCPQHASI